MPLLFALTSAALMLQAAPSVGLISYDEAVRCAGLTQAASELEGGESAEGKALSDAALYWSLTAGQAAVAAGKPPVEADRDQSAARQLAVRRLTAGDDAARAELEACRRRTPDLG